MRLGSTERGTHNIIFIFSSIRLKLLFRVWSEIPGHRSSMGQLWAQLRQIAVWDLTLSCRTRIILTDVTFPIRKCCKNRSRQLNQLKWFCYLSLVMCRMHDAASGLYCCRLFTPSEDALKNQLTLDMSDNTL